MYTIRRTLTRCQEPIRQTRKRKKKTEERTILHKTKDRKGKLKKDSTVERQM